MGEYGIEVLVLYPPDIQRNPPDTPISFLAFIYIIDKE